MNHLRLVWKLEIPQVDVHKLLLVEYMFEYHINNHLMNATTTVISSITSSSLYQASLAAYTNLLHAP